MLGWASSYIFLGAQQRRLFAHGPAILTYHRMGESPAHAPDPFLYDTAAELESHLAAVNRAGLRLVSLGEAAGGDQLQPGTVAITFDDAFVSALEQAVPVLARHRVRAVQFVVAGRMGGRNEWDLSKDDVPQRLMDAAQIRDWLAAGHEIGSHTMTHRNLKKLAAADAREEIFASKKFLEDLFGVPANYFCFPYGGWEAPALQDLVIEAGYQCACTTRFGVSESKAERWSLRRITPFSTGRLSRKIWHRVRRKMRGD